MGSHSGLRRTSLLVVGPHLALAAPFPVGHRHQHAVLEQAIDLPVRRHRAHGRAVAADFLYGGADLIRRLVRVKALQGGPQARQQHHLGGVAAAKTAAPRCKGFIQPAGDLPAQLGQQGQGGLFHQAIFVVGVRGHTGGAVCQRLASGRAQIRRPARDPMGSVWMPS